MFARIVLNHAPKQYPPRTINPPSSLRGQFLPLKIYLRPVLQDGVWHLELGRSPGGHPATIPLNPASGRRSKMTHMKGSVHLGASRASIVGGYCLGNSGRPWGIIVYKSGLIRRPCEAVERVGDPTAQPATQENCITTHQFGN